MVSVAVVGAGHWGPHLIRNFHESRSSSVRLVIEIDAHRREQIARRYHDVEVTDDLSAMADADIDAVVVASPLHTHHAIGHEALCARKHVLIEKPFVMSADGARDLCELADRVDRVLMVGHTFLFNPGIHALRQCITLGELGVVRLVTMQRTNLGPVRSDVNAAWDLASHDVSIAAMLLGDQPVAVSAVGQSWLQSGIQDAAFISLHYPQGILVNIQVSWMHPRKTRNVVVVGSDRMATFDDMELNEPVRIYDNSINHGRRSPEIADTFGEFRASIEQGDVRIPRVRLGEPLRAECEEFIARVEGRSDSHLSDGWSALGVIHVLEAIDQSMEQGGARVEVAQ